MDAVKSNGQSRAIDELSRIEQAAGGQLKIDYIQEPANKGEYLLVEVSFRCDHYERVSDGLQYKKRETIRIYISWQFPYVIPSIWVLHTRLDGFPHVQWKSHLCLYQSPNTEWRPEAGMFGFMRRIDSWFKDAALNQLDSDGVPLHPPAVYTTSEVSICVNEDTPEISETLWIGGVKANQVSDNLIDLTKWISLNEALNDSHTIPAILLSKPFGFEYPRTVKGLFDQLLTCGVKEELLIILLSIMAKGRAPEAPMYFVIGTPMRGEAGDKQRRKQHLAVWEIKSIGAKTLNLLGEIPELEVQLDEAGKERVKKIKDDVRKIFNDWAAEAKVDWCQVFESRPEVTQRRDQYTAMNSFTEKSVVILGCGALGGQVAEHIVRAGVANITLVDNKCVHPGILVRQNFVKDDIGHAKVDALAERLRRINNAPELVRTKTLNLSLAENELSEWLSESDYVIDTTASIIVRTRIEAIWSRIKSKRAILASMMISSEAQRSVLAIAKPNYTGATLDILRKLGLTAMNSEHLHPYKDAFWPKEPPSTIFQPEPGCSDPTFIGSHADIATLAAQCINRIAIAGNSTQLDTAEGHLISSDLDKEKNYQYAFESDIVIPTPNGTDVRISKHAWRDIYGWVRAGTRTRGAQCETGGLIFGEMNETANIIWITEVIGPPSDSSFSESEFVCGTNRTEEINKEKQKRTNNTVHFIGSWHSHPVSPAIPSNTDCNGIAKIFASDIAQSPKQLMLIIGNTSTNQIEIGAYIFHRSALQSTKTNRIITIQADGNVIPISAPSTFGKYIGLALSGGGSRAIAFHLGCLRALNDLNLLDDVKVISGVSGGSVMTSLYGYSASSFEEIEKKTEDFLTQGVVRPGISKLIFELKFIPLLLSFITATIPALVVGTSKYVLDKFFNLTPLKINKKHLQQLVWPIRRWYTRTHVIADVFEDTLGDKPLASPTRDGKDIVLNACELQTGTAFRMSNRSAGSWRFGEVDSKSISLANAVAASAAYPPALPAFDWRLECIDPKTKEKHSKRLIITDGGIYENLGVSCLEPGRSFDHSVVSYNPDIIISCDAGAGQFTGDTSASFWPSRMSQSFNSVFRKVQDATKTRLHEYHKNKQLEAFVYMNLGQIDKKVPEIPSDWIYREEVFEYPTNFSVMKLKDLEKLSKRGEILTRRLISRYLL